MASTRLTAIHTAGPGPAAAECISQVVQISDKPSLQEEFMDLCTSPLPPKVTVIPEVDKYWQSAKLKTA